MELKGEYKDLDFQEKMYKRIAAKLGDGSPSKLNEFLEIYNTALEKVKLNNWLVIYKVLSILIENLNIKYTLLQVKDGIFENTTLSYIWLVLNDEGQISNDIYFRYETKKEYETRISNVILKYDKAIIEVDKKYKQEVESTLDSICSNWNDQICIRYIEANIIGVMAETILTGKLTDEYIDLVKDSEMFKALGMDKIIEKGK